MKIDRTKNASRNIVFGTILNIYQIVIPFMMRTAMVYFMGIQYTGLNSLFTSVLQVLNLAELGVGSAMTYSMYKPIAEDDSDRICALMGLYRLYYRVIGLVIAVIGVMLTPFISYFIKGDAPDGVNIYILYLLNLSATVLTYWLFAYKNCLLTAHQRNDITSKITMITNFVQYILQFLVIYFFHSYYGFVVVILVMQAVTNILTAMVVDRLFPNYKPVGKLDSLEVKEINAKIRDLFTAKIGSVITNSVDTIVISAFLGLEMLAIYQNYFLILSSILGFVTVVFTSCRAGIGNSLVIETKEKNFNDFKLFTFISSWLAGFCTCCLLALYQPAMELWMGKEMQLEYQAVICFCVYFFIRVIHLLLCLYKDAAGIWRQDRLRPLITALSNLVLNLFMVQFCGIYGVILSTVISTFAIGMPWLVHNLFTTLFDRKQMVKFVKCLVYYVCVTLIACILNNTVCAMLPFERWGAILGRGVVCLFVPNVLYYISYHNREEFRQALRLVNKIIKGKIVIQR